MEGTTTKKTRKPRNQETKKPRNQETNKTKKPPLSLRQILLYICMAFSYPLTEKYSEFVS